MTKPLLSIGLVTYNSARTLRTCFNSIARTCPVDSTEIIVVDNNSDDDSVMILEEIPFISKLIINPANVGFAAGVNTLIREKTGRHLLLLNPDCQIETPLLPVINKVFASAEDIGIIGADVRNIDGNPREAYGAFPSPAMVYWDFSGLRKIFPRKRWSTSILFDGNSPTEVDFPTGAFFCIREEALKVIGDFDDRFFAYFEEVDYALRLRKKGYRAMVHPSLRVKHYGGASFIPARTRYDEDFQLTCYFDSLMCFLEKHYSEKSARRCAGFIRAFASFKGTLGGNTAFGRRHKQVARILDKLKGSNVREIYGI